jgi:hypothetical protein
MLQKREQAPKCGSNKEEKKHYATKSKTRYHKHKEDNLTGPFGRNNYKYNNLDSDDVVPCNKQTLNSCASVHY